MIQMHQGKGCDGLPFAVQYMTDVAIFIDYKGVVYSMLATITISYMLSFVAFMFIESPMHNL